MTMEWPDEDSRRSLQGLLGVIGKLKDLDKEMPVQQMQVLVFVALNEGKTQTEIRSTLDMAQSTLSRCIAILSTVGYRGKPGLGLVTWTDHPTDRRANILAMTPKGRTFMAQILDTL